MALDFGSAELTQQTNNIYVPAGFITKLFFGESKPTAEKYVKVHTTKGGRKLAPFVSPKIGGKVMTKNGVTVDTYEPALLKPKYVTEADNILAAQGVEYADGKTAQERAEDQLLTDETQLKNDVYRRVENMAVSLVTTGKFTAKGDGVEEEFDYGMDANNIEVLSGTVLWTDASSTPLEDLAKWADEIFEKTGQYPNSVVMGATVYAAFKRHASVKDAFDNRNITIGELKPAPMMDAEGNKLNGVVYAGHVDELDMDIYRYVDFYDDENDVVQDMFPKNKLVMGSANATGHVAYAGITDRKELGSSVFVGEIFVKTWSVDDPDDEYLLGKSKPLPIPSDIDSFKCVTAV